MITALRDKNIVKKKGGRPQKKVKKEVIVMVRMTTSEHFLIAEKAKQAGMRISEWLRKAGVKAKVAVRFSMEDLKTLRMLTGMANNLNQLTRLAHQQGLLLVQRKCRELLSQIDDTLTYLNKE